MVAMRAFLTAFLLMPLSAVADVAQVFHLRIDGGIANAVFLTTDASDCIMTSVSLSAVDGRVKQAGRPDAGSTAILSISQVDICNNVPLLTADGTAGLSATAFQIDKQLGSATLNTTLTVVDAISGNSFPVDVDVAWTASGGRPIRTKDSSEIKAPGLKVNTRFDANLRQATATGTVSDGTTNFTPEPASQALLATATSGELDILH